ncbi:MAG TPA: metalloregulator ArsR/SmtB family transcription factor [Acidimicrobiales bacterium]|nr:metalloregulator ArsR/SmtB family transcription factor [Acidimicrobiales bacterium]
MTVDVDTAMAEVLKVPSEPIRLRIVLLLSAEELCVCHLVEELGVPQPLVSHHLRVLREADLVGTQKWRYWTYYRLRPEKLETVAASLGATALAASRSGTERRPCC